MQLSSGTHIPDGLLAAMVPLSEKPRLGGPTSNPIPHLGFWPTQTTMALGHSWSVASGTRWVSLSCEFGACGYLPSGPGAAQAYTIYGNAIGDVAATLAGKALNVIENQYGGLTTPRRLFGTYYCGSGGAGPTSGDVNSLCYAHDTCFNDAHINADGNTNPSIYWSPAQVDLARGCNQTLYNALKQIPNSTGSQSIRLWLLYGDQLGPLSILRPGTHVQE
jgi:hypothetical protein